MHVSANSGLVVAVDGPSGAGKSSAARGVARALGLRYLDTGSMYRALTWWMLHQHVDIEAPDAIADRVAEPAIEVSTDVDAPGVRVDGTDVTTEIRRRDVTRAVSAVSAVDVVRKRLIAQQRELIESAKAYRGIVAEGRDIGTVVAPDAPVKIFLTASEGARADRRTADAAVERASYEVTEAEMTRRDRLDAAQSAKAEDAVLLDSTALDLQAVIDRVLDLVAARAGVS